MSGYGTRSNFAAVANPDVKREISDYDTPEFVAETGLEAFLQGKLYVITGSKNKMVAFLPRLFSRKRSGLSLVTASRERSGAE